MIIPHTHPIINGRVLLPGHQFTARNRISGRLGRYTYRGTMGESGSGRRWVNATDHRGLARSIDVETITIIHRSKAVA